MNSNVRRLLQVTTDIFWSVSIGIDANLNVVLTALAVLVVFLFLRDMRATFVAATTLTLAVVFLPTAFMGGIPGLVFREFGITAAVAVLASLLVARLLTPMMAAYLLKLHVRVEKNGRGMTLYLRLASWCLVHRAMTALVAVAFFIGSLMLVPLLPARPVGQAPSARLP